jgi:hypothetical protein
MFWKILRPPSWPTGFSETRLHGVLQYWTPREILIYQVKNEPIRRYIIISEKLIRPPGKNGHTNWIVGTNPRDGRKLEDPGIDGEF